jgi:hypothetical protein
MSIKKMLAETNRLLLQFGNPKGADGLHHIRWNGAKQTTGRNDFLDLVLALQRRAEHVNVHGNFLTLKNARNSKVIVNFATTAYAR